MTKKVNFDRDNPLRLGAVGRGESRYFTGETCVRGHVADRYSKSGRCIKCCSEDRSNFARTSKGKVVQQRKDDIRRIRRGLPSAKGKTDWWKRLELYNRLVAAGLPVVPGLPLKRRVHATWFAFNELTNDKVEAELARREQRQARRAQALADAEYARVRAQERAALRTQRKAHDALRRATRVNHAAQARANGIPKNTAYARVHNLGWTWERACSEPVGASMCKPDERSQTALRLGIKPATYKARLKRGLSPEQAAA